MGETRRQSVYRRHPRIVTVGLILLILSLISVAVLWKVTRDIAVENLAGDLQSSYSDLPSDFNITYENISLETSDGVALTGWWMPTNGTGDPANHSATVLMIHGYEASMSKPVRRWGNMFGDRGYNMMAIDLRGHGGSESDPSGMVSYGDNEVQDVLAAIRWLKDSAATLGIDPDRIIVGGQSMGAQTTLLTAIRASPEDQVAGVISDSGFASFERQLYISAGHQGYPGFLAWMVFQQMKSLQDGFDLEAVDAVDEIGGLQIPHLILHCDDDERVTRENFDAFEEAGNDQMTAQSFHCDQDGDNHVMGHFLDDEYDPLVLDWVNQVV